MSTSLVPAAARKPAAVERAFLPAALEIVETPASPTARYTAAAICGVLVCGLVWASVGKVDLVATAPGKVVPIGRTKQVQAFEGGVVRKILVEEGDVVKSGQDLILLDPALLEADRDRFQEQAMRAGLDEARLVALIAAGEGGPVAGWDPFAGREAPAEAIEDALGRLTADLAGRDARLAAADREIASKRAEKVAIVAELAKVDASLPLATERMQIRKTTSDKGIGSRLDYLNAEQQRVDLVGQRAVLAEKLAAAEASVQAMVAERQRILSETERDWRSDLQKARRDLSEARSELAKAERRTGLTSIVAPVDGVVQDLSVHTEGGVVQAGQQLLRVVPLGGDLAIEAVVENKDVGFVRTGEEVEIKVEAFPYTRHGLVHGRVERIARDAAPDPETIQGPQAGTSSLADSAGTIRRSGGLVYLARISMDDPSLMVDGVRTPLEAGMAVTAEIKTGRRRVIDYLLSPLVQHGQEAMRER